MALLIPSFHVPPTPNCQTMHFNCVSCLDCETSLWPSSKFAHAPITVSLKTLWQLFFFQYAIVLVHNHVGSHPQQCSISLLLCIIKLLENLCVVIVPSLFPLVSLEVSSSRFLSSVPLTSTGQNAMHPPRYVHHTICQQHPFRFHDMVSFCGFFCCHCVPLLWDVLTRWVLTIQSTWLVHHSFCRQTLMAPSLLPELPNKNLSRICHGPCVCNSFCYWCYPESPPW